MGALDFMWDMAQSGQIASLEEKVDELEKKVEILKEWVDYLEGQLKELKNGRQ